MNDQAVRDLLGKAADQAGEDFREPTVGEFRARRRTRRRRWAAVGASSLAVAGVAALAVGLTGAPSSAPETNHPAGHATSKPSTSTRTGAASAPFRLRIVLADTSVRAGGRPIHGYILAINSTGRPLEIRDAQCDAWVQAGLSGRHVHFAVTSLDVACGSAQLREGVTRIPVTIPTSYTGCQQGKQHGTPDLPHCIGAHDSTMPVLPPGTYHVVVGTQHVTPAPTLPRPVLIRLLP
jgi:hypothetical protein